MIGDSAHDLEAGKNAGCRTAQLIGSGGLSAGGADVVALSLLDAVHKILKIRADLCATSSGSRLLL